jgi:hypothetical protein
VAADVDHGGVDADQQFVHDRHEQSGVDTELVGNQADAVELDHGQGHGGGQRAEPGVEVDDAPGRCREPEVGVAHEVAADAGGYMVWAVRPAR